MWADSSIDFIGIDNYFPLSDWRDGFDHADAQAGWSSVRDLDYLKANIEGGERFDWYYASDADRTAQTRTTISDSFYGEPWIWQPKDMRGWWQNLHHDRLGGVRFGWFQNCADPSSYAKNPSSVTISPTTGSFGPFTTPARIASGGATWHGATPGYRTLAVGERVVITAYVAAGTSGEFSFNLTLGSGSQHAGFFGALGGWGTRLSGRIPLTLQAEPKFSPASGRSPWT